jgi:NAD(P)-dependent dehydrogenase (short-subunit alcohol dehydrogenase family)
MSVHDEPAVPRAVVVTGAGSGIGRASAAAFAALGDAVYALDLSEDAARETASQLDGHGVQPFGGDVSNYAEVERVVEAAVAEHGRLDVMVSAAGVYDAYAGIDDTSPELWERVLSVNLTGAFNACRAAVRGMRRPGGGRLITVGSIGAARGAADGLAYCASKAGLEGMNRRLALDVAERGITANVICPGAITTAIRETSRRQVGHLYPAEQRTSIPPEVMDWIIPIKRFGQAEEIAGVAVFLASDAASYITGQTITIDGGWTAQ